MAGKPKPTKTDGFDKVLKHIETLPDFTERIGYLIEKRAEWIQNKQTEWQRRAQFDLDWGGILPGVSFRDKCDVEIAKIKQLLALRETRQPKGKEKPKINRHPNLTIDRAILLIDAIGGSRLQSADNEKLAEVIAFLTGDQTESVRQRYSALNPNNDSYKGLSGNGMEVLQEDLKIVSHYVDLIGLRNEMQKISEKLGVPFKEDEQSNDEPGLNDNETESAKSLASICPMFAAALPETRRTAWKMMGNFTRKQWAYFSDSTGILKSSTKMERARRIEEIVSVTSLRDLFGNSPSETDKIAVNKVTILLKADAIKATNV